MRFVANEDPKGCLAWIEDAYGRWIMSAEDDTKEEAVERLRNAIREEINEHQKHIEDLLLAQASLPDFPTRKQGGNDAG